MEGGTIGLISMKIMSPCLSGQQSAKNHGELDDTKIALRKFTESRSVPKYISRELPT